MARTVLRDSRKSSGKPEDVSTGHWKTFGVCRTFGCEKGHAAMAVAMMYPDVVRYGKSCFGGGAHCIEQAARAITGRLIPQLPARRRFHRTLLISAGPSP
jgi:hypothetical protein